jgi:hypothetical protein
MSLTPSVVEPLLAARRTMLAHHSPLQARQFDSNLRSSASQFSYHTLDLFTWWMAQQPPLLAKKAEWVWARGEAHHAHVCTLANGKRNRFGDCPIYLGWRHDDDRHHAPWYWDIVRLLSSVQLTCPTLSPSAWQTITQALCADYVRILSAIADGDEHAERFDFHGLPEVAKQLWHDDGDEKVQQRWWKKFVRGKQLIRRANLRRDDATKTWLANHFSAHGQVLDCLRCDEALETTSLGQASWLVLFREAQNKAPHDTLRLGTLHARRPSHLAHLLCTHDLTPSLQRVTLSERDPYAHDVAVAGGTLRFGSWDHTRKSIALNALDAGDFIRLARYWGQLIACAHGDGLRPDCPANTRRLRTLIAQVTSHQRALIELSQELTVWYQQAYRTFAQGKNTQRA